MATTNCPNCGAAITEDNNGDFCKFCGSKIPKDEPNVTNIDNSQSSVTYVTNNYIGKEEAQPQKPVNAPPLVKKREKSAQSIVGIVLGAVLVCASLFGNLGIGGGIIGAIVFSISVFSPRKLNYCPNCNSVKDFKSNRCPQCGKPFGYGAGMAAAATGLAGFITFVLIFFGANGLSALN